LRQIGKRDTPALLEFCERNAQHFSAEGLRYALEKQPEGTRNRMRQLHKEALAVAPTTARATAPAAAASLAAPVAKAAAASAERMQRRRVGRDAPRPAAKRSRTMGP